MRELQGVMFAGRRYIDMKRRALLFDKFQIWRWVGAQHERPAEFEAEIAFLKEAGIVVAPSLDDHAFDDATSNAVGLYAKILFLRLPTTKPGLLLSLQMALTFETATVAPSPQRSKNNQIATWYLFARLTFQPSC